MKFLLSGFILALLFFLASPSQASSVDTQFELAPDPFSALRPRLLVPNFLDVAPRCVTSLASEGPDDSSFRRLRALGESLPSRQSRAQNTLEREIAEIARTVSRPAVRSCAWLEAARLALRSGFGPEATAHLGRAERALSAEEMSALARGTLDYYRAEALVAMKRDAEALERVIASPAIEFPRLALALELRRFDLETRLPSPQDGESGAAYARWKRGMDLLDEARERNFDLSSWAARAGEQALAAERLSDAHRWFAAGESVRDVSALAAIRKADVLMLLDRPDDARRTLRRIIRLARVPEFVDLARVRLARYRLSTQGSDERMRLLFLASRSNHPVVEAIARDQLALELTEAERIEEALGILQQLAYNAPAAQHAPRFPQTLDTALTAVTGQNECSAVLGHLALSWELFLRHSSLPEPFARTADCFMQLGMFAEGLRIFRGLARTHGIESVPFLAWRIAYASLETDDLLSARAALRASLREIREGGRSINESQIAIADADAARWWWLAGQLAIREGRDEEALRIDTALLASELLPAELRGSTEERVGRLVNRLPKASEQVDPVLQVSLDRFEASGSEKRAFARMQLADRSFEAGDFRRAGQGYRHARRGLDAASPSSRADYRIGMLVHPDAKRERLREAAGKRRSNPWSRLSGVELRLMSLRESVGLEASAKQ